MSYEVLIRIEDGTEDGLYLGSSTDLITLGDWVRSLPADLCPNLRPFVLDGRASDAMAVCAEIDPALDANPPEVRGVAETADHLAEVLDRWPDGTLALISDGTNTPDNWWEDDESETDGEPDGQEADG